MFSQSVIVSLAALLSLVNGHAQILGAQGISGSPTSVGFQVDPTIARNCTTINPCQQDATIIRDAEIAANTVNECGRTELSGNIDIGENTENALAAGAVTQVQSGTRMTVTIHQVNADGAGPFVCDLVEAGNNGIISANLSIENNVPGVNGFSQAKAQDFNMTVIMPQNFTCTGSSAGNVCTVRCRNNAQAGPFGGCIPVQQVDVTPNVNTPANIPTALALEKVQAQVLQDQKDFAGAVKANQDAGTNDAKANAKAVTDILGISVTTKQFPTTTVAVDVSGSAAAVAGNGTAATTTAAAAASKTGAAKKGKATATAAAAAKNNNKRSEESGLRWARRFVLPGQDYTTSE